MQKRNKRLPRSFSLDMDPRNYYEFEGLLLDFNTQKIWGLKNGKKYPLIGESRLQFLRERENKSPKVLHASSSPTSDVWFSSNHQLLSYDHLIAVDTNTHSVNGSTVSITAAFHVAPQVSTQEKAFCYARILAIFECWNVKEKPENLGWWQVLKAIESKPQEFSGKIGLIVDSDLGRHNSFNDQSLPIVGDYRLPKNVKIIYASDKGGQEQISTKMIRYCHNLATDLYKEHNLVLNIGNLNPGLEGIYSHFRQWDISTLELRPFANYMQ